MNWTAPIDIYCERTDVSFWAEPINALSNLAFILVGLYLFAIARRQKLDAWTQILCLWIALIGVGSFLFHTFANRWSALADVIPIWTFFLTYIVYALRRYLSLSWLKTGVGLLAAIALLAGAGTLIPDWVSKASNGSSQYAPAIIALFLFSWILTRSGLAAGRYVALATVIFAVSITIRSLDMHVCHHLPTGIHFFWHMFNAVVLGVLGVAAVRVGSLKRE